jgi:uncharacterized protein YcbK (DUF882 family)
MAQLPTVQDRGVVIQGARSRVTAQDVANPYQEVAQVLGQASDLAKGKALDDAANSGDNAVFRDPNGELHVKMQENFSQVGRAYNRAASQAYMARLAGDVRKSGSDLAIQAKGNPETFNGLWKGFRDTAIASAPRELRGAVTTLVESEGARFGLGVSEIKRSHDLKTYEGDIKSEIDSLDNEMAALAQKGGVGTSAYRERQARVQSLISEMVQNPDFTLGQKEADRLLKGIESRHMGYALVGKVEGVLQGQGVVAARKMADSVLTDETLGLSPSERRSFSAMMDERINSALAVKKAELEPVKAQASVIKERLKLGVGLDNGDVDKTAQMLAAGGDTAGAMELIYARSTARETAHVKTMTPAERVDYLAKVKGSDAVTAPSQRAGDLPIVTRQQSGRKYAPDMSGVQPVLLDKFKALQNVWGASVTVVSGFRDPVRNKKAGGAKHSQHLDGNALDLDVSSWSTEKRVNFIRTASSQGFGGIGVYGNSIHLDLGARRAWGPSFHSDSVPDWAKEAIGEHLAGSAKGAPQDHVAQADYAGFDPDLVKSVQSEVTADTHYLFDHMKAGVAGSMTPAPEDIQLLSRQLAMIDDPQLKTEIQTFFESEQAAHYMDRMAGADREALIGALKSDAAQGATIAQQEILRSVVAADKSITQQLTDNPIGYAVSALKVPPPEPLDMRGAPDALMAGLKQRQLAVDVLENRGMAQDVSALQPQDLQAVKDYMASATPEEAIGVLHAMASSLSDKTFQNTTAAMAGKDGGQAMAVAGALYSDNPQVAESVLRGSKLLLQNAKLAPKEGQEYNAAVTEALPLRVFANGMEKGRQDLIGAARARYADLSAQEGDESGEVNTDRLTRAVSEITGGFVSHNGEDIIAPVYGMNQEQFDAMLAKNGPSLLSGAVTAEGEPVTLENLTQEGRLRSVGNGEYLIEFGSHTGYPTYARAKSDRLSRDGGAKPFILDLRQ